MSTVTIRNLKQSDLPQVRQLRLKPDQEGYVGGNIESVLLGVTARQHSHIILSDSTIVGFFILDENYSDKEKLEIAGDSNDLILRRFFVDDRYQGKGIAGQALQQIIQNTAQLYPGTKRITLTVNCQNPSAPKAYLRAGFVQDDKLYHGGTKGPQHIMWYDLPRRISKVEALDIQRTITAEGAARKAG